jgi:uncharacterized protein (DUF1499 family)
VRANVVCPGFVRTPLVDKQIPEQAKVLGISEEDVIKHVMLKDTVDGEFTTTEDVAAAVRKEAGENPVVYEGARIAEQQRRAYPDLLPLTLALAPPTAFNRALDTAQRMGWTIVAADDAAGRIEASDRSRWFGFTDDIVIRVTASGAGSRIDLRSSSRLGRSDFGVNAARIGSYLAALRAAAGGSG